MATDHNPIKTPYNVFVGNMRRARFYANNDASFDAELDGIQAAFDKGLETYEKSGKTDDIWSAVNKLNASLLPRVLDQAKAVINGLREKPHEDVAEIVADAEINFCYASDEQNRLGERTKIALEALDKARFARSYGWALGQIKFARNQGADLTGLGEYIDEAEDESKPFHLRIKAAQKAGEIAKTVGETSKLAKLTERKQQISKIQSKRQVEEDRRQRLQNRVSGNGQKAREEQKAALELAGQTMGSRAVVGTPEGLRQVVAEAEAVITRTTTRSNGRKNGKNNGGNGKNGKSR